MYKRNHVVLVGSVGHVPLSPPHPHPHRFTISQSNYYTLLYIQHVIDKLKVMSRSRIYIQTNMNPDRRKLSNKHEIKYMESNQSHQTISSKEGGGGSESTAPPPHRAENASEKKKRMSMSLTRSVPAPPLSPAGFGVYLWVLRVCDYTPVCMYTCCSEEILQSAHPVNSQGKKAPRFLWEP